MKNADENWFNTLPEEGKAMVRGMHQRHANANVRIQLLAILLLGTPMLVRYFYPEPWAVWATLAAICWPVGAFMMLIRV